VQFGLHLSVFPSNQAKADNVLLAEPLAQTGAAVFGELAQAI